LPQFDTGKPYDQPFETVKHPPEDEYEIEAISGATITSKGIINAVNTVTAFYKQMAGGAQ
jgi:Na+-transporting NADH:ubiquinone oxidoreductase subunit NqrC